MKADLLLITPPFTQLNTPYPATAYLKGFLNTKAISSFQMDLGIEVILTLFSKQGLTDIFQYASKQSKKDWSENAQRIFVLQQEYGKTIEATIAFLQGKNASLARQICMFLSKKMINISLAFGNKDKTKKRSHKFPVKR